MAERLVLSRSASPGRLSPLAAHGHLGGRQGTAGGARRAGPIGQAMVAQGLLGVGAKSRYSPERPRHASADRRGMRRPRAHAARPRRNASDRWILSSRAKARRRRSSGSCPDDTKCAGRHPRKALSSAPEIRSRLAGHPPRGRTRQRSRPRIQAPLRATGCGRRSARSSPGRPTVWFPARPVRARRRHHRELMIPGTSRNRHAGACRRGSGQARRLGPLGWRAGRNRRQRAPEWLLLSISSSRPWLSPAGDAQRGLAAHFEGENPQDHADSGRSSPIAS
jgi:hypothetical protein